MDKLCLLEDELNEKVDVKAFEELEGKIQKLEESMNQKVEELKERIVENETKVERIRVVNDDKGNREMGVVILRNKRKLMQDEVT